MLRLGVGLGGDTPAAWWPPEAVFAADFVADRYMRGGATIAAPQGFALARASAKMAQDRLGRWRSFPPHSLARTDKGALIEPEEIYYPVNSALIGAVPGVYGAGGALPTDWSSPVSGTGTFAIDDIGTWMGLPSITFTWNLLNETASSVYPNIRFGTQPAAQGQTWTGAVWFDQQVEPDDTSTNNILILQERGGGAYLGTGTSVNLAGGFNRLAAGRTLTQPGADSVWFIQSNTLQPGQRLHRTMTMAMPTLTKSGILSSPMLTGNADAVMRAEDNLSLTLPVSPQEARLTFASGSTTSFLDVSGGWVMPQNTASDPVVAFASFPS